MHFNNLCRGLQQTVLALHLHLLLTWQHWGGVRERESEREREREGESCFTHSLPAGGTRVRGSPTQQLVLTVRVFQAILRVKQTAVAWLFVKQRCW